jgi:hypothetical protein
MRRLRTLALAPGARYFTVTWAKHWPALFNSSGKGDSRFSPLAGPKGPVPVLYGARSQTAALLETVFHDAHPSGTPLLTHMSLVGRALVRFELPERAVLYDLSDAALANLHLQRSQLTSTSSAHYACTRQWAEAVRSRERIGATQPVGIIWGSRVAELAQNRSALLADLLPGGNDEVFVLFGDRLAHTDKGHYSAEKVHDDLSSPESLPLVLTIAELLGVTLA